MGNVLEAFKTSQAWDHTFDLPLVPIHNNPFIYAAYATRIIEEYENPAYLIDLQYHALDKCAVNIHDFFGLYNRWPGGVGGQISHDEIIGLCYISPFIAKSILSYLKSHFGFYDNISPTKPRLNSFMYRYPFLYPFIKIRSGFKLNILQYITMSAYFFFSALFTNKKNSGEILLQWIMVEGIKVKYPKLVSFWIKHMNRRKLSPKICFQTYLERCPVFRLYAPIKF